MGHASPVGGGVCGGPWSEHASLGARLVGSLKQEGTSTRISFQSLVTVTHRDETFKKILLTVTHRDETFKKSLVTVTHSEETFKKSLVTVTHRDETFKKSLVTVTHRDETSK